MALLLNPTTTAFLLGIGLCLVNAPVALYRNRERSVPDMQLAQASGISRHGDAAFADFALLLSVAHRFWPAFLTTFDDRKANGNGVAFE
jgi:hypothetical protein